MCLTRRLLYDLTNILCGQYGWDPSAVFVCGFSQGAAVALDMVCAVPWAPPLPASALGQSRHNPGPL
jgi:predicted esterase